MTIALFTRHDRKSRPISDVALLIGVSAGGLILSLVLTALIWSDGSFANAFVGP